MQCRGSHKIYKLDDYRKPNKQEYYPDSLKKAGNCEEVRIYKKVAFLLINHEEGKLNAEQQLQYEQLKCLILK